MALGSKTHGGGSGGTSMKRKRGFIHTSTYGARASRPHLNEKWKRAMSAFNLIYDAGETPALHTNTISFNANRRVDKVTLTMKRWIAILVFLISSATGAAADDRTFRVEHKHLWKSCTGELIFGESAVTYRTSKPKHSREWKYGDIQQLEIAKDRVVILTYDARKRELGRDQSFRFKILEGTPDEALRGKMEEKLARPLISAILPEDAEIRFSIPARHRLFMGGAQGALEFSEDYVLFRAERDVYSRVWRYDELLSLGNTGPFRLRLGVLEKTGGEFGEEKPYNFDLKRRPTDAELDFLWEKINRRHLR